MKIPIKVLTEIVEPIGPPLQPEDANTLWDIEWHDNNGINSPYLVRWINKE